MRRFSSRISVKLIRHVGSHSSIVMVTYIICNMLLQLFTTSRVITAPTTVVPFCFQAQLLGGFTSTKTFLSVASSETLIWRFSLMKYGTSIGRFSFKIAVLNIFGKFLGKHPRQSSYSAYL